jgi:hypothetical protein
MSKQNPEATMTGDLEINRERVVTPPAPATTITPCPTDR